MMFYFYVLYSLKDGKLYKGYTSDLAKRVERHNSGGTKSTKHRRPFALIYHEEFTLKGRAMARERWSKSLEGGSALMKILIEKGLLDEEKKLIHSG